MGTRAQHAEAARLAAIDFERAVTTATQALKKNDCEGALPLMLQVEGDFAQLARELYWVWKSKSPMPPDLANTRVIAAGLRGKLRQGFDSACRVTRR